MFITYKPIICRKCVLGMTKMKKKYEQNYSQIRKIRKLSFREGECSRPYFDGSKVKIALLHQIIPSATKYMV